MVSTPDHYRVLGLRRDASADQIKNAYRKLAREYHPDVNHGDPKAEAVFKRLNDAYEILSDPAKRSIYDDRGRVALGRPPARTVGRGLGGVLRSLFLRRRGDHIQAEVQLEFLDALRGTTSSLTLRRAARCATCRGRASTSGCSGCRGTGRQQVDDQIRVRVPPGVGDGDRVRVPGQGEPGRGGAPPGDLYVAVRVRPHPTLRLDGRDLVMRLPLAVWEAALGVTVEVQTLDGAVSIRVPAGTQPGQRLRLRGKGVPGRGGEQAGDQFIEVQVVIPGLESEPVRALMGELSRLVPSPREGAQ